MLSKIIVSLSLVIFSFGTVSADEITFLTHSSAGRYYLDDNGDIRGKKHAGKRAFNIELVREMMIIMKHSTRLEHVPLKRGLLLITTNEKPYGLFNIGRRPYREGKMKWVGPLQTDKVYLYELKNTPTGITTLEDAQKVDFICVLNGTTHDTFLTEKNFPNIYRSSSYEACFKMLVNKRVNLTPISHNSLIPVLKKANISPDLIRRVPVLLFENQGQLAFTNLVPDSVVQQWQNALDQLKQSGRYDQLIQAYLLPERDQEGE